MPPGLVVYRARDPVGWCSVGPREEFTRVRRSPVIKPVDAEPDVWSVVCFYVDDSERGQGVASLLLSAALRHAKKHGARILEAYPIDPAATPVSGADIYVGVTSMFLEAGFQEVMRRRDRRAIHALLLREGVNSLIMNLWRSRCSALESD